MQAVSPLTQMYNQLVGNSPIANKTKLVHASPKGKVLQ